MHSERDLKIAEAVWTAVMRAYIQADRAIPAEQMAMWEVDLDAIIASVPKPDPVGYINGQTLIEHKSQPLDYALLFFRRGKTNQPVPIYTAQPDAQAEIDRLNVELTHQTRLAETASNMATQREAFIEELLAQRHDELVRAVNLGWEASGEGFNYEYCRFAETAATGRAAIVAQIEQWRMP